MPRSVQLMKDINKRAVEVQELNLTATLIRRRRLET